MNDSNSSRGASALPYPLLLCPGSSFIGYQAGLRSSWTVRVTILDLDVRRGTCSGRMDAIDTPGVDSDLVATFFEGQLIDNVRHTFGSQPTDSQQQHSATEQKQWKSVTAFMQHVYPHIRTDTPATPLPPASATAMQCDGGHTTTATPPQPPPARPQWPTLPHRPLSSLLLPAAPPSPVTRLLHASRYMFMRWSEQFFLCGADGRLSIGGVYLLAFDRLTGEISGIYWDEQAQTRRAGKKRCQQLRLQRVPDAARDGRISTHGLH